LCVSAIMGLSDNLVCECNHGFIWLSCLWAQSWVYLTVLFMSAIMGLSDCLVCECNHGYRV